MRNLAAFLVTALAAAAAATSLLAGCIVPECGVYEGAGDRVYARGNDSMILCESGAYAATLGDSIREGRYLQQYGAAGGDPAATSVRATTGETGAVAFEMTMQDDATYASFEIGAGWTLSTLDATALDHAHVQCADVESRGWFARTAVPTDQAFTAQRDGVATTLVLCANGLAVSGTAASHDTTTYSLDTGAIVLTSSAQAGLLQADGRITDPVTLQTVWEPLASASVDAALRCQ